MEAKPREKPAEVPPCAIKKRLQKNLENPLSASNSLLTEGVPAEARFKAEKENSCWTDSDVDVFERCD